MIFKFKVHLHWDFREVHELQVTWQLIHKSFKIQSNLLDFMNPDEPLNKDTSVFPVNDPPEFMLWQVL